MNIPFHKAWVIPTTNAPPPMIRSVMMLTERPHAFHILPRLYFFELWCLGCILLFLFLFLTNEIGCSYYQGFAGDETVYHVLNLPPPPKSTCTVLVSFIFVLLFHLLASSFFHPLPLALISSKVWTSNWLIILLHIILFVVGKCTLPNTELGL